LYILILPYISGENILVVIITDKILIKKLTHEEMENLNIDLTWIRQVMPKGIEIKGFFVQKN